MDKMKIFIGSSNKPLGEEICRITGIPPGELNISRFSNDCISVQILESVREKDVFVIQSLYPNPSESLMELMLLCDALRSASAWRITAVIPHYSYARSDKKDKPRISIAARLVADVLITAGATRFLTMNLHSEQVRGFSLFLQITSSPSRSYASICRISIFPTPLPFWIWVRKKERGISSRACRCPSRLSIRRG